MRTIIRLKERKEKWVNILGNGEVRLGLRMQENEKKENYGFDGGTVQV